MASAPAQAPEQPLFTVPVPACGPHPGGSVTCTEPQPAVYVLTLTSPPDNRLTSATCAALLEALDRLEHGGHAPGLVVTTSGLPKFFSNGLDLAHATSTPGFWETCLFALFRRLLTFPMPTAALVTGHAFAGGLMLAMYHDYRVAPAGRGLLCLNELDFGSPLLPPMASVFREKCAPSAFRALVLEARRFSGAQALEAGIVDGVGGLDEVLRLAAERKLVEKGRSGVYGLLKAEMYRHSLALIDGHEGGGKMVDEMLAREKQRKEEGKKRVEEMEGKAKL